MITSDEVNYLVYRYLAESGFTHSAFAFQHESALYKRTVKGSHVRPGSLVNLLQKGLQYAEIECHVNEDGTERKCIAPFTLLEQHECAFEVSDKQEGRPSKRARKEEALTNKKDRKDERKQSKPEREKKSRRESLVASTTLETSDAMDVIEDDNTNADELPVSMLSSSETVVRCSWNPGKPSLIASGSKDGVVRLWQVPSNATQDATQSDRVMDLPMGTAVVGISIGISALEWAPSGAMLAAGTVDGRTLVWTRSGELKFSEKQHEGAVFSLAWNTCGSLIATGSLDKTSVIWDVASGQVRQRFDFHEGPVLSADWVDDVTFATSSSDSQIYVCRLGDIEPLKQFSHKSDVNKVLWDPSRKYLASCSDDGTAKIWTMDSNEALWVAKGHEKEIVTCQWCPNSDQLVLATAGFDRTVRLWDVAKQECLHTFRNHNSEILSADFNPDASLLASASSDGVVNIWSLQDWSLVKQYHGDKGEDVDVQAKWNTLGNKLALICGNRAVAILHLPQIV
ncbi:uncharacterized protein SPPG_01776 [Spizellomyces punctatus DAOM BR117]|uniref:Anaphase-promoting complex subunit 4-like WD40 domain-containing protein n=1 Tax=Spizellomyces punctatus (strain DAOM BR117) TaxID=645134 RepID=A0A0L0HP13_SPIPD|nr:uncharacterized protein SPPG_01776 [Spizellomyces punctatus DAOM BR117]KND02690.1 hypothetical protein SPPG_01776 [Spizellomyces punctatus DAOM BR117]|eukprot:XP_016610729.1 hypothetical protein SPPG_01776 [Spizellomyces punctatus DAOM BR117]